MENRIISSAQRLRCSASSDSALHELQREVAIAGGVNAVRGGRVEAEAVGHQSPIQRQRRTRNRSRSQRTNIQPLAAIRQPVRIPQKHLDIGQQPMPDQNRLGPLQMRVCRHRRIPGLFRPIRQRPAQLRYLLAQFDRSTPARTSRRSVAICSLRLRPLCSLYPVSPISATSCFSTK